MLKSTEVRWFYEGNIGKDHLKWYQDNVNQKIDFENRSDYYLKNSDINIGIKSRESRLEIKLRTAYSSIHIGDKAEGMAEYWTRLQWTDTNASTQLEDVRQSDLYELWNKVEKRRIQTRYKIKSDRPVKASPCDSEADYAVELTELTSENRKWWTLSFDLFGKHDTNALQRFASNHFTNCKDRIFNVKDSYGYPKWLSILK
jgi:tRNA splicing endonuclease